METNTLKRMWETRPPRIPQDQGGKAFIGGVCEGIGARYQIDPTLIRVLFVVLSIAFGGGLFLYLLCWINMPRFGLTRTPASSIATPKEQLTKVEKKERDTGWLLLLGLVIFFPSVAVASDLRGVLVTFALFVLGWYLAYQRQPEAPEGLVVGVESQTSKGPVVDTSHLTVPEGYEHPGQKPPAWDPLGAAPELWHLPDPVEPAPERAQPKKRYWLWIPVTLVLTTATMFALGVTSEVRLGNYSRFGSAYITVYDIDDAELPDQRGTSGFIGESYIDFTELEPLSEPKTVNIANHFGSTDIMLPENVPVDINCKVTIGEVACPEERQNADTDSALLTINVSQRVGSVSAYYAREDAGEGN